MATSKPNILVLFGDDIDRLANEGVSFTGYYSQQSCTAGRAAFTEQRAKAMQCWSEPFVRLRIPKIFNLRRDPFERADENSNTYWDFTAR